MSRDQFYNNMLLDQEPGKGPGEGERPAFLVVLCVLSFVGVGLGIMGDIYKFYMTSIMGSAMDMINNMQQPGNSNNTAQGLDEYLKFYKYGYYLATSDLIGNLIVLPGVIMMWKLKAKGFIVYVTGQVIPIIVYYSLMGFSKSLFGVFSYLPEIFAAVFIMLYAFNLRSMK